MPSPLDSDLDAKGASKASRIASIDRRIPYFAHGNLSRPRLRSPKSSRELRMGPAPRAERVRAMSARRDAIQAPY